ncbi:MAG: cytochrome c biogenesis protein CcsA [Elusimicrobia bacterium]|nr:cytochrome c biogenesis protein CcsA [Elusimicrobiota bacterium]
METAFFSAAFALYAASTGLALAYVFSRRERITLWMWHLLGFALAFHMAGFGLRTAAFWRASEHRYLLPIHTWFGALSAIAFFNALIFWLVEGLARLKILGAFVLPWTLICAGAALAFADPAVAALAPDLRSSLLNAHPLLLMLSYTAFANAFGVSLALLIQERQIKSRKPTEICYRLPAIEDLDRLQSRIIAAAFLALSAGIALGVLWTFRVKGKPWGADAKVLAAWTTWVLYAAFLAGRRFAGLRGRRAAQASMLAFASLVFTLVAGNSLSELHAFLSNGK